MNRLLLTLLLVAATPSFAGSVAGTSAGASTGGASNTSGSSSGDDKVVREARDDAAGFVASDGRIRSARLDAALRSLRARDASNRDDSDMALARRILAH